MLPYSPSSTFFFKVKFDEPYLMYRDWREVTKSLLTMQAKSSNMNPNNLPKSKMRRPETKVYVDWAIKEIKRNPKAFAHYQNNKGIIKTREMFLEWLASNEGKQTVTEPKIEEEKPKIQPLFTKTIIVPIAIPGSGT
jgi:tRNA ligase